MQDLTPQERVRKTGRRVRRHSRLVALMKVALPLAAVALVAVIFLSARHRGSVTGIFSPQELAQLGAGLRLENPRFAGVTAQGEPFVVHADWALPDSTMPRLISLEKPRGQIKLSDGRTVSVSAATGRLDRGNQTGQLEGNVSIKTSDGYQIDTAKMDFDFKKRTAIAPGPVHVTGPSGSVQAGRMHAQAGSKGLADGQIWFENRVRVVFIPAGNAGAGK